MNNFNILWIDDDWNNEHNEDGRLNWLNIKRAKDRIESLNPAIVIHTRHSKETGVFTFFHDKSLDFDLLIIDIQFGTDPEADFKSIIEGAREKALPAIIFSNSSLINMRKVVPKENPLIWGMFEKQNSDELVECVLKAAVFKPLHIVHISDFHFDSSLDPRGKSAQAKRFESLTQKLEQLHRLTPFDLVIFTGDFAARNPAKDFDECFPFIQQIVQATTGDYEKLLIIPGNHDIEWADYQNGICSSTPAQSFHGFLNKIYGYRSDLILSLIGHDMHSKTFDTHYDPDSFCWTRQFPSLNVEILGLNSVTVEKEIKGKGKVNERVMSFIGQKWKDPVSPNRVRIALLHHNILPPFSTSKLEETENIVNSGEVIELLAAKGCNLILSGHCHNSYLYNFSYSLLSNDGFMDMRNISYVSTGTSGGYAPGYDRARTFNTIHLFAADRKSEKIINVTPYLYDSINPEWKAVRQINSVIKQ